MMNSGFLISALAGISVLTSLTVQAIKKLLNDAGLSYSSNILAMTVSIFLTLAVSVGYVIYKDIVVTPQVVVAITALMFLSFLTSTVGYDKVTQAIKQLGV